MNEQMRRQIMEEVAEFTTPPRLEEHEFTASQYAEENDLHIDTARKQLNKQVRGGRLEARWVMHSGHRQRAYRMAD